METTFATRDQAGAYRDRTLTAVFEREDEAERAIAALKAAGFTDARIRLASGTGGDEAATAAPESSPTSTPMGWPARAAAMKSRGRDSPEAYRVSF